MGISQKCYYAIKAVFELAQAPAGKAVKIGDIAERQCIPAKFLEAILLELTRHGLLQSKLGRGGGYVLARKPGDITVGEIIRILEGPLALIPCVSRTAYRKCDECLDEDTCGVRLAMKEVRDATAHILDNTTLAGLNARSLSLPRRSPRAPVAKAGRKHLTQNS